MANIKYLTLLFMKRTYKTTENAMKADTHAQIQLYLLQG